MPLLGWRYPLRESLESRIDKSKCYPVSVIKMSEETLRRLLGRRLVTVADIPKSAAGLAEITGIPINKAKELVERAKFAR